MPDDVRPRVLGYTDAFDEWADNLPAGHFDAIDAHMRSKARRPLIALSAEPEDVKRFTTFVTIDDRSHPRIRGYRVDYEVTGLAVIVIAGRRLLHRHR